MSQAQYAGTGRRKNAVARVRLVPGTGKITVNKKDVEEYIPHADLRLVINQPFAVTSTAGQYDVFVNVNGGGYGGQAGAIRHGIARALLQVDPDFRDSLKRAGLLTRDSIDELIHAQSQAPSHDHLFSYYAKSLHDKGV